MRYNLEKTLTPNNRTELHLQRQAQALIVGAYLLWLLTICGIQTFGFGTISTTLWKVLLALVVIGNLIFWGVINSGVNLRWADPYLTFFHTAYAGVLMTLVLYILPAMRPVILLSFIPIFSLAMLCLKKEAYLGLAMWVMGLYGALLLYEHVGQRPMYRQKEELFLFMIFGFVLVCCAIGSGFIAGGKRRLKIQHKTIQMERQEISPAS